VGEQDSLICACLSFYRPLANHHKLVKSWSLLFFLAVDVRVKDALIRPFFSFYQPAANQHKRANLGRTSGSLMFNLSWPLIVCFLISVSCYQRDAICILCTLVCHFLFRKRSDVFLSLSLLSCLLFRPTLHRKCLHIKAYGSYYPKR
jgi:hypothetical protein